MMLDPYYIKEQQFSAQANRLLPVTMKSSKQRRELINQEIDYIRTLLPVKNRSLQRLSQLEVMSMACIHIRRCHFLGQPLGLQDEERGGEESLMQAVPGFFLVCTSDGKLVYISSNVTDFLGHSTIDITKQGDNIYDIVDTRDHPDIRGALSDWSSAMINFKCRIALSRYTRRQSSFFDEKPIQVTGYFTLPADSSAFQGPVFIGLCTPILSPAIKKSTLCRTSTSFTSVHRLDMTFVEASNMCEYYLGVKESDLIGRSWYDFISPDTLSSAADHHLRVSESQDSEGTSVFYGNIVNFSGASFPAAVLLHPHKTDEISYIICTVQVLRGEYSFNSCSQGVCQTAADRQCPSASRQDIASHSPQNVEKVYHEDQWPMKVNHQPYAADYHSLVSPLLTPTLYPSLYPISQSYFINANSYTSYGTSLSSNLYASAERTYTHDQQLDSSMGQNHSSSSSSCSSSPLQYTDMADWQSVQHHQRHFHQQKRLSEEINVDTTEYTNNKRRKLEILGSHYQMVDTLSTYYEDQQSQVSNKYIEQLSWQPQPVH